MAGNYFSGNAIANISGLPSSIYAIDSNLKVTGNATTTGSLTWTNYASCTALETDANGLMVCGADDTGVGGGGGSNWQIYNNNPVWLTPTTTGAGIYLTRSATTTENMYFGGLQFTRAGDNYLYFDNAQTNYLQWNDTKDWFALSNDLEITGIVSSTAGFRLNDKFRVDSSGNTTSTGALSIGSNYLVVKDGGLIGINTTTPGYRLTVNS